MVLVLNEYFKEMGFLGPPNHSFCDRENELLSMLYCYSYPPFTIQRLVEILLNPKGQYKNTHKLINAIEKLLSVTSPSVST
jgi:hypothetical protein